MTLTEIAGQRLINQQLTTTKFKTARDIVSHLGAIQAQDYAMAKWAMGTRLPNLSDQAVEQAINKGEIVRTHILRPTWHFVAAEDLRWMLTLTAPHIRTAISAMLRSLALDEKIFKRSNAVIIKTLSGNKHLTRKELMTAIAAAGIPTDDLRGIHLMLRAELDGIVCNGPKREKQFTYALLDEKIPLTKNLKREEALAKLAERYFFSHGPATLRDFAWWSGLPVTDAKTGLALIKNKLVGEKAAGSEYWFSGSAAFKKHPSGTIHLLPAFDEFMVSYKDRTASLDTAMAKDIITGNGIFRPVIVINGKVTGVWKRTVKKDEVLIEIQLFKSPIKSQKKIIFAAAEHYGKFLGMKTITRMIK